MEALLKFKSEEKTLVIGIKDCGLIVVLYHN